MKRLFAWLVIAGVGLAAPAFARTYFSVNVGIGVPPPPQRLFYGRPPLMLVPGTSVYYVDESEFPYDCFLVDGAYYLDYDGYWYRAPSYRGPWIAAREVPQSVLYVPHRYWHDQREGARWIARRDFYGSPRSYGGPRDYGRSGYGERGRFYGRPEERSWNRGADQDRRGAWNRGGDREQRGAWNRGGDREQHGMSDRGGDREQRGAWNRGGDREQRGMSDRGGSREGGRHEERGNGRGHGEGHRRG